MREAATLLGTDVVTTADARDAARRIGDWGPAWVVVKAGHMVGDAACDVVFETATGTDRPRARPAAVAVALDDAKRFVHQGLARSAGWRLGAGHGPVGKLGAWS